MCGGSLTSSEGSSQGHVGPAGRQVRRQSAPAAFFSAETTVRHRSRISFELAFDEVMSDMIEGLNVDDDGGADDESESFDDILDKLSSTFKRSE